jgi:hypothetical protein
MSHREEPTNEEFEMQLEALKCLSLLCKIPSKFKRYTESGFGTRNRRSDGLQHHIFGRSRPEVGAVPVFAVHSNTPAHHHTARTDLQVQLSGSHARAGGHQSLSPADWRHRHEGTSSSHTFSPVWYFSHRLCSIALPYSCTRCWRTWRIKTETSCTSK